MKNEIKNDILQTFKKINAKVGNVLPRSFQLNDLPSMNPKKQALVHEVLNEMVAAGLIDDNMGLTQAGFDSLYTADMATIKEGILNQYREINAKVGNVLPRGFELHYVPSLNPKEQALVPEVLKEMETAGLIDNNTRLTKTGFDLIY